MKYDIVLNSKDAQVDVTKTDSTITVTQDGRKSVFNYRKTSSGWILEKNGKIFHTNIQNQQGEKTSVNVNERTLTFDWKNPYAIQTGGANAANSGEVRAVMPGRVVKILVSKGQEIEANQPLLVLEAMKMENEIKSSKAGKITEIHVIEGASVESGANLIHIE